MTDSGMTMYPHPLSHPPRKRPRRRRIPPAATRIFLTALVLTCPLPARAQEKVPPPLEAADEVAPGHADVRAVRPFIAGGGRVDWSAQGDWIAFDRAGEDGRYDIWVAAADGGGEECLTCDVYDLRKDSSFNPSWHPSGRYLVFQVQNIPKRLGMGPEELATPLRGLHSELWMISRDGRRTWQLTRVGERGGAITDPRFAHEGESLLWSERVASRPEPWGEWVVRTARLEIGRGVPHLGKVRTFRPGGGGPVLAQELTANDRGFLYAAETGASMGLFRFEMDDKKGTGQPVGPPPGARGQMGRLHPGRGALLWSSSLGMTRRQTAQRLPRREELWLEDPSGGPAGRLTFFNHPRSDLFLGEALVDDAAWSPDGDRILAHVVHAGGESVREDIYLIVLSDAWKR